MLVEHMEAAQIMRAELTLVERTAVNAIKGLGALVGDFTPCTCFSIVRKYDFLWPCAVKSNDWHSQPDISLSGRESNIRWAIRIDVFSSLHFGFTAFQEQIKNEAFLSAVIQRTNHLFRRLPVGVPINAFTLSFLHENKDTSYSYRLDWFTRRSGYLFNNKVVLRRCFQK